MPDYVNRNKIFEVAWEINVNLVKEDLSRVPKNNPQTTAKGCVTRIRCCVTRIRWVFGPRIWVGQVQNIFLISSSDVDSIAGSNLEIQYFVNF